MSLIVPLKSIGRGAGGGGGGSGLSATGALVSSGTGTQLYNSNFGPSLLDAA